MNRLLFSPFLQARMVPAGVPVGTVVAYAGLIDEDALQAPARRQVLAAQGWLVCDGSQAPVSQYPHLSVLLGSAYGKPKDGHFYLPDFRGVFLRGVSGSRPTPNDPGAAQRAASGPDGHTGNQVGTLQTSQLQEHEHEYTAGTVTGDFQPGGSPGVAAATQSTTTAVVCKPGDAGSTSCFGAETRPLNLYVYYLIKATTDVIAIAAATAPTAPESFGLGGGLRR